MKQKGYVHVYTGNGKGKTTASIGLAIRALGAGKRVLLLQFMKSKSYSEHNILKALSANLEVETMGKPFFIAKEGSVSEEEIARYKDECVVFSPGNPPEEYKKLIADGLERAMAATSNGEYDLVILDEVICALFFELVSFDDIKGLIENKCASTEVVLTGRGAPSELIDMADLVTEMKEIKHYYTQGIQARRGIEN